MICEATAPPELTPTDRTGIESLSVALVRVALGIGTDSFF